MAINYTTLTGDKTTEGSIKNWVNRSDIPATVILTEAEAWIYQHLRVREMLAVDTITIAADADSAILPSDFLDPIEFKPYTWGCELPLVHEKAIRRLRDENGALFTGTPSRWTAVGATFYVNCKAIAEFGGELLYYAQPDALSGSNETNFLTTRYPGLLRHACMARAFEHMKDYARFKDEQALAIDAYRIANATNEMWRRSQIHDDY